METVVFEVPGEPIGKARPRVVDGHAYTPSRTKAYEQAVRLAYKQAVKDRPEPERRWDKDAQLSLQIAAFYQLPKRVSRQMRGAMLRWEERPKKKPDLDNILKIVADALNDLAYHDDSQIVHMHASKYWSLTPSVTVTICEVSRAPRLSYKSRGGKNDEL